MTCDVSTLLVWEIKIDKGLNLNVGMSFHIESSRTMNLSREHGI